MKKFDLAVIGAGPAGMAAASKAANLGLTVCLLDEQPAAGGQIYRDVDRVAPLRGDILGKEYTKGRRLTGALDHPNVTYIPNAVVWSIEDGFEIIYSSNSVAAKVEASRIILATGAIERPMPIPGWTLAGVMTAGAGQILLKQSGMVAKEAVLVGSGPLLYLVAAQMVRAGRPPLALIETQSRRDSAHAAKHFFRATMGWRTLLKGVGLLTAIWRGGVKRYVGATNVRIIGDQAVQSVEFTHKGQIRSIACHTVFLHHGVIPNTQISRALEVQHAWDDDQLCFRPILDDMCRTSRDNIWVAGDGGGIAGAYAAELSGQISALDVAICSGLVTRDEMSKHMQKLHAKLATELAPRPFLDRAYPPYPQALSPSDETIICRCEDVTAGDIRKFAALGCMGPNQAKAFGRVGMGRCQGRNCGITVTKMLSDIHNQTPDATGYFRIRPPLKPVTLGEIASMATDPD